MLVLFDIDGTLADPTHRLHYILNTEGRKDWDGFYNAVTGDTVIPEIMDLCRMFENSHNHQVVYATGRSRVCQADTIDWLAVNAGVTHHAINANLYMRDIKDRRPDYLVKHDMLVAIMANYGGKPDLVFEDRQQVVKMWRDEGIRCCQVDVGDF